jgi:hypothetical protein
MLSVEQVRSQAQYAYRNGMSNVVWLAGMLRRLEPGRTVAYIQQTNNLNQMLRIECEPNVVIPERFAEGQPIKVIARMDPARVFVQSRKDPAIDVEQPTIKLLVKRFETPSLHDMPAREAWQQSLRPGVPSDGVKPADFKPDQNPEAFDGWKVHDTGNMGNLAGFVAGYRYEEPVGGAGGGCLVVLVRQTKDERELLPVRCYSRLAAAYRNKLAIGMPVYFEGRMSVMVKNRKGADGKPIEVDGVLQTDRYQYLHVREIKVPGKREIAAHPDWVDGMILADRSLRESRRAAAEAKKAAAAPVAPAIAAQSASAQATQVAAATVASTLSADVPADVMAMLQKS